MEKAPRTFISYSSAHSELKNFFTDIMQDLDFNCITLPESQSASIEEARALIQHSDCFIALLSPDLRTAEGKYVCQESVNIQIGLAHNAKLPIQLFAFDNVDVSNIVFPLSHNIAKIQIFKTKFGKSIIFDAHNSRLLFKTLLDFKKQVNQVLAIQEKTPM